MEQNFFQEILQTKSLTVIHYKIEDNRKLLTGPELEAANKIYETNELDEIWAICHDQLGNSQEAEKLRKWLNERKARRSYIP